MARLFGTDGVRGRANVDLTAELALDLAVAAAHVLGEAGVFEGLVEFGLGAVFPQLGFQAGQGGVAIQVAPAIQVARVGTASTASTARVVGRVGEGGARAGRGALEEEVSKQQAERTIGGDGLPLVRPRLSRPSQIASAMRS